MMYRFLAAAILLCFYGTYLGKMLCQRRRGIQTDQMAKGDKPSSVRRTELLMKVATFLLAAVQAVSVLCGWSMMPAPARAAGAVLGLVGDGIFLAAVYTMRDSWRAGIDQGQNTQLVHSGIYRYSRNPAFLGFDVMYLGVLLLCFNPLLLLCTLFAIAMLHRQILQEEAFLPTAFGEAYTSYCRQVRRYWGRRR